MAEANSYSTSEIKTGRYWINGKPIYRKVFNCGNLPNTSAKVVNIGVQNIEDIVRLYGIANTTNIVLPLPYVSSDGIYLYAAKQWGQIVINTTSDVSSYYGCLILEYTKTTD